MKIFSCFPSCLMAVLLTVAIISERIGKGGKEHA